MKAMTTIAIFVATLLLAAHMAFAISCDQEVCYDVTKTYENGVTGTTTWRVCLTNDGIGNIDGSFPIQLFGGSVNGTGFDAQPNWTTWIIVSPNETGHIWTDTFGLYLNGEGYLVVQDLRWTVKGIKVPCGLL